MQLAFSRYVRVSRGMKTGASFRSLRQNTRCSCKQKLVASVKFWLNLLNKTWFVSVIYREKKSKINKMSYKFNCKQRLGFGKPVRAKMYGKTGPFLKAEVSEVWRLKFLTDTDWQSQSYALAHVCQWLSESRLSQTLTVTATDSDTLAQWGTWTRACTNINNK